MTQITFPGMPEPNETAHAYQAVAEATRTAGRATSERTKAAIALADIITKARFDATRLPRDIVIAAAAYLQARNDWLNALEASGAAAAQLAHLLQAPRMED